MDQNALLVGALVFAVGVWLVFGRAGGRRGVPPVVARPLLTANEREFFGRLRAALPDHVVLAQVAMGALITTERGLSNSARASARGRFSQKIVDFVVLDASAAKVLCLVELDDRSHRPERDALRDAITSKAGYRTVRFDSCAKPPVNVLRRELLNAGAADA